MSVCSAEIQSWSVSTGVLAHANLAIIVPMETFVSGVQMSLQLERCRVQAVHDKMRTCSRQVATGSVLTGL